MSQWCDEAADVYSERATRARKAHTCAACGEAIAPGHVYTRVSIVFDGTVESLKRCARCQKLHEHLRTLGDHEMWPAERLDCGEEYAQHWGEDPPPEIAALAFALPGEETTP